MKTHIHITLLLLLCGASQLLLGMKPKALEPRDVIPLPIENGSLTFTKVRGALRQKDLLEQQREQLQKFCDDNLSTILSHAENVRAATEPTMKVIENALAWILFIQSSDLVTEEMDDTCKNHSDDVINTHMQLIHDTSHPPEVNPTKEQLQDGIRACTIIFNLEQDQKQLKQVIARRKRLQRLFDELKNAPPSPDEQIKKKAGEKLQFIADALTTKSLTCGFIEEILHDIPEGMLLTFCKKHQDLVLAHARALEEELKRKERVKLSAIEHCFAGLKLVDKRATELSFELFDIERRLKSLIDPLIIVALNKADTAEATEHDLSDTLMACDIALHTIFLPSVESILNSESTLQEKRRSYSDRLQKMKAALPPTPHTTPVTEKQASITTTPISPQGNPVVATSPPIKKNFFRSMLLIASPLVIGALVAFALYTQYDKKKILPKRVT